MSMIKNILVSGLLLLVTQLLQAQEEYIFSYWNYEKGNQAIVSASMANVRSKPSLKGAVTDSLECGTGVQITSNPVNLTKLKGLDAPWFGVRYKKDGKEKTGFIWGGVLAIGSSADADGRIFLFGVHQEKEREEMVQQQVSVIVLNAERKILTEKQFWRQVSGQSYYTCKLIGALGLKAVDNIFRMEFSGEACGIATNYFYYAWNGNELLELPGKTKVSDAGVYYYTENLLFPSEHKGKDDLIIKWIISEAMADEDEVVASEIEKKKEIYNWDSRNYKKQE